MGGKDRRVGCTGHRQVVAAKLRDVGRNSRVVCIRTDHASLQKCSQPRVRAITNAQQVVASKQPTLGDLNPVYRLANIAIQSVVLDRCPSSGVIGGYRICLCLCRRAFKNDQLCALNFDQGQ